jgi:hypothetical protein
MRVALGLALAATVAACGSDGTGPSTSLIGTWDLLGFTEAGVAATTTGIWIFRADGTMHVDGTIAFPGEPAEPLVEDGTFSQSGTRVTLTLSSQTGAWTLVESGGQVTLTQDGASPGNTIILGRRSSSASAPPPSVGHALVYHAALDATDPEPRGRRLRYGARCDRDVRRHLRRGAYVRRDLGVVPHGRLATA